MTEDVLTEAVQAEPVPEVKACSQCQEVKAKTAFKKDSDPLLCIKCHRARLHGKSIALADADASLPWVTRTTAKVEKITLASLEQLESMIKEAKPKDLAIIAAVMIDKRALLRGEPTTIIGHEKREQMLVLAEALTKELARRANVIDVTPKEVQPMLSTP